MSNALYDKLKYVALIALPACATFFAALATIWGIPYGDQITATITAGDTFLGALLVISTAKYNRENK